MLWHRLKQGKKIENTVGMKTIYVPFYGVIWTETWNSQSEIFKQAMTFRKFNTFSNYILHFGFLFMLLRIRISLFPCSNPGWIVPFFPSYFYKKGPVIICLHNVAMIELQETRQMELAGNLVTTDTKYPFQTQTDHIFWQVSTSC